MNNEIHIATFVMALLAECIDWVKTQKAGAVNHRTYSIGLKYV